MHKTIHYIEKSFHTEHWGNSIAFEVPVRDIVKVAVELATKKCCVLKLMTATDDREEQGCFKIWYIFGVPSENRYIIPYLRLENSVEFPSLAPAIHAVWNYEKKIRTFFGLKPIGHPDERPIILHENWPADVFPLRKDFDWRTKPAIARGTYRFQKVKGEGIYEIPVGPIHAGIIEPGHFRFSVAGEEIIHLEPRLGFTHKGIEKLFEHLPLSRKIRLSEKIAGDSSFSHSLCFCQAVEQLNGISVGPRARYLRLIYAELERLANHFGDIGAITLDAGFNFGGSHGARLREKIMRINERLTGSRFLRGVNTIGGVLRDIRSDDTARLISDLMEIQKDFTEVIAVIENSASLLNRLKGTGILSREVAAAHGVVGVAAKAAGIVSDSRIDFPYAAYDAIAIGDVPTEQAGDVYARYRVRVNEVFAAIRVICRALETIPEGQLAPSHTPSDFPRNAVAVSIVEGWRGEIVYFLCTDSHGSISRVAPRDPSFINWAALEYAGPGNIVPDFPLINKSFNLSYTGNDL
jgi:Ni,Fe-hydrogenase III large subunit/Ni,Fe-hydrogenase III component G